MWELVMTGRYSFLVWDIHFFFFLGYLITYYSTTTGYGSLVLSSQVQVKKIKDKGV
jgi:hypothetical protein